MARPGSGWRDLKEEVLRLYSPLDVAQRYGLELRRMGRVWAARCPFHPDTRPSFFVYPDGFHCFGCGWHGNVVDFVAAAEQVGWREALDLLAGGHLGAPKAVRPPAPEERAPTAEELAAVQVAWETCRRHLRDRRPREYLARRGIPLDVAEELGLGYWAPGVATRLEALGLVEAALAVGLLRRRRSPMGEELPRYWEPFRGRVIIPDLTRGGQARWLTGRAADDVTEPKYLNLSLPKPLLGLDTVEGEEAALVEGPLDWVAARAMGLPAVATLGAHVGRLKITSLARFRRVFLLFDADEAGQQAARDLAKALGRRAVIVPIPKGAKDVADLLLAQGGKGRLLRAMEAAREKKGG
jgi:DNA primase